MTDAELKTRLRDAANGQHDMTPHGADLLDAIDAIEALEAKLALAVEALEFYTGYDVIARLRGEPTWGGLVALANQAADRIEALEAKLAQAEAGMRDIAAECGCSIARATLATLKGDKP